MSTTCLHCLKRAEEWEPEFHPAGANFSALWRDKQRGLAVSEEEIDAAVAALQAESDACGCSQHMQCTDPDVLRIREAARASEAARNAAEKRT
jgi:hypothetical protein